MAGSRTKSVDDTASPGISAFTETVRNRAVPSASSPPPRKPGRPRDPERESRRRQEILAVAARVFAQFGFAATDVQVIADRVSVGKGTIYRYFPSKDKLFLAAVEQGLAELSADMDQNLADPEADPVCVIQEAILTYLKFFRRRPEMAELFIQERAAFPTHHRPLYFTIKDSDEHDCQHRQLFARLLEGGFIRPMPHERFFAVIGDLLYGTILTNLLTGRQADPETQAADIIDIIFRGVLAPESRAWFEGKDVRGGSP